MSTQQTLDPTDARTQQPTGNFISVPIRQHMDLLDMQGVDIDRLKTHGVIGSVGYVVMAVVAIVLVIVYGVKLANLACDTPVNGSPEMRKTVVGLAIAAAALMGVPGVNIALAIAFAVMMTKLTQPL